MMKKYVVYYEFGEPDFGCIEQRQMETWAKSSAHAVNNVWYAVGRPTAFRALQVVAV